MDKKIINKDGLTPEQEKFFANSQVRDENGRLLKCYHGTPTRGITHFENSINWFTPVKEYAQEFDFFNEGDTHEVYLNCKNLFYAGDTNGNVFSPFKPTTPYKLENKVIRLIDKLNVSESEFRALIDEIDKELGFDEVDSFKKKIHDVVNKKQFRDLLVSKGYDGIKAVEANNIITYGVFYPEDIKAVTNLHPTYKKNINEETEDIVVIDDYNMSEYIHDNVFSKSLNQILNLGEIEVTNTISKKSPQFILPNGSIIDAHKYLEDWEIEGEEVHAHVLDRIFIRIMENSTDNIDFMFSSTSEFLDEFTDVYGLVRINPGTSEVENRFYCVIPYKGTKMTSYQYDKLEEFLNIGMLELDKKDVTVMSTEGEYAHYYFKETFPEDIIKKIKRYYSSGRLMEEVKRVVEGEYIWFDNGTPWLSVVDSYPLPELPKTLYHGTTARNASLINKEGVIKQGDKNWEASVDGVVYLTSSIADAKEYIRRASDVDDSQIVIYEIPTSELNLSKLYIDGNEEYYWDEVSEVWDVYNFMYKGTIPIKSNKGINETLSYNRLYHKTTPMNAVEILRSNTLRAGGTYNNNAVNGKCICFSRDYNFIENMPGKSAVIFVINKNKLASRYKITPITDYKNFFKPTKTRFKENSKAEEICQQDITDVLNYVDKILVTDNIYDEFIDYIKDLNINKEIIKQSEFKINKGSNDGDEEFEKSLNNTEKEVLVESKQDWDKFKEWCGDDLFSKFKQVKNRLVDIKLPNGRPATDIYFWMKHGKKIELERIIHNVSRIAEHDRKAREGAKLLYNNGGWKVYEISTPEASQKYGKGTRWCISGGDAYEYFDDDDIFYFYIYGDTKYAVAPNFSGNGYTIYNEMDDRVAYIPDAPQVPNLPDVSSFDPDVVRGIAKLYKIKESEIESIEPVDSEYMEFFWDYGGPEHYTVTLKNGDVKYCTTSNAVHEYIDLTDEFLDWLAEYVDLADELLY